MTSSHASLGPDRLNVAIVDESPLLRMGVAHALGTHSLVGRIVEGTTADDALRLADTLTADILLLDPTGTSAGPVLLESLPFRNPALKVIALASSDHEDDVARALRVGARGYVLKTAPVRELMDAVSAVCRGERYLSSALGARVLFNLASPPQHRPVRPVSAGLTHRELEIVKQVSVGSTNKEIAIALGIREKTVKFHMTNIMEKLQVRNRVEAVLAVRNLLKQSA